MYDLQHGTASFSMIEMYLFVEELIRYYVWTMTNDEREYWTPNVPNNLANTERKKKVGNYIIGGVIGEGSFAKVKLAQHILADERVAVKIINKKDVIKRNYMRSNLRREATLMQRMEHPNIVRLHEVMETDNSYYIIMDLIEGTDFVKYLTAKERLSENETRRYIRQIVSAVDHMHKLKVIHRDIKLQNFILNNHRNMIIIDFGLSNCLDQRDVLNTQCGSPAYAAPEIFAHREYGPEVDVWSIGVNMYAMLTGRLPFRVENRSKNLAKLHACILKGAQIPDNLSPNCQTLLRGLLEPTVSHRYTLKEVFKDSWLNENELPIEPILPSYSENENCVDLGIVQYMNKKFGFNEDEIKTSVIMRTPNTLRALYYLLHKRKMEKRDFPDILIRSTTLDKKHLLNENSANNMSRSATTDQIERKIIGMSYDSTNSSVERNRTPSTVRSRRNVNVSIRSRNCPSKTVRFSNENLDSEEDPSRKTLNNTSYAPIEGSISKATFRRFHGKTRSLYTDNITDKFKRRSKCSIDDNSVTTENSCQQPVNKYNIDLNYDKSTKNIHRYSESVPLKIIDNPSITRTDIQSIGSRNQSRDSRKKSRSIEKNSKNNSKTSSIIQLSNESLNSSPKLSKHFQRSRVSQSKFNGSKVFNFPRKLSNNKDHMTGIYNKIKKSSSTNAAEFNLDDLKTTNQPSYDSYTHRSKYSRNFRSNKLSPSHSKDLTSNNRYRSTTSRELNDKKPSKLSDENYLNVHQTNSKMEKIVKSLRIPRSLTEFTLQKLQKNSDNNRKPKMEKKVRSKKYFTSKVPLTATAKNVSIPNTTQSTNYENIPTENIDKNCYMVKDSTTNGVTTHYSVDGIRPFSNQSNKMYGKSTNQRHIVIR
ncbi:hypothetical protein SNEBB_005174 [Seison nebaliae]|nr:hypothetical protein SNEBB_005174 [Seison nebaliae]